MLFHKATASKFIPSSLRDNPLLVCCESIGCTWVANAQSLACAKFPPHLLMVLYLSAHTFQDKEVCKGTMVIATCSVVPCNCSVLNSWPTSSHQSCPQQRWTEQWLWMQKWWACQIPHLHSGQNWKALPGQSQALGDRRSSEDGQKLEKESKQTGKLC